MADQLKVHLYCLCWNDARMLPFFFRHYDSCVDRYFVFDNGSTDQSLSILQQHGKVEISHFDVTGDSFVDEERRLSDTIWKGSDADWVIVTDIDEHVYHPELREYLKHCLEKDITAIQSIGYEMVSDFFPSGPGPLVDLVTAGARSAGHDRLCIFNPRALTETNYSPGRHRAAPQGKVVWPEYPEVLLLHFKQLGVDYPIARSAELLQGLKARDIEKGWGVHYSWSSNKIQANWQSLKSMSGPVPGLGTLQYVEPPDYNRTERTLITSGLIDREWYLRQYEDINPIEVDPLLHFCIHGWKEGRRPNFYFDPDWYTSNYPDLSADGRNPLFDYITRGEPVDAWPSPQFNTKWYRETYGIERGASPLAHYLKHRKLGKVSPVPEFKVVEVCTVHPEMLAGDVDPFEASYLSSGSSSDADSGNEENPA